MADLSPTEAAKLRVFLGYDRRDRDLSPYLVDLTDEDRVRVLADLAALDAIDAKMTSSVQLAGVYTQAEEVSFRGSEGQSMLAAQGNAIVRRLAQFLGIEVRRLPFNTGFASGPILRG